VFIFCGSPVGIYERGKKEKKERKEKLSLFDVDSI